MTIVVDGKYFPSFDVPGFLNELNDVFSILKLHIKLWM